MQSNYCHYPSNWASCDTAQSNLPSKGPHHMFGSSTIKFSFFLYFGHTTHLWGFDFSVLGATFLRKYLSVSPVTVLSDACRPGTICVSTAHPYFVNTPSLRFWFSSFGCHFSQKMSFSQPWNCVVRCLSPRYMSMSPMWHVLMYPNLRNIDISRHSISVRTCFLTNT